jgi:hypothetical protein
MNAKAYLKYPRLTDKESLFSLSVAFRLLPAKAVLNETLPSHSVTALARASNFQHALGSVRSGSLTEQRPRKPIPALRQSC